MDKELALRTFAYLIGHYKTHNETTINEQEIEAIEFILKDNENLEQQVKKQKEVIDRIFNYLEDKYGYSLTKGTINDTDVGELYEILSEVSE